MQSRELGDQVPPTRVDNLIKKILLSSAKDQEGDSLARQKTFRQLCNMRTLQTKALVPSLPTADKAE